MTDIYINIINVGPCKQDTLNKNSTITNNKIVLRLINLLSVSAKLGLISQDELEGLVIESKMNQSE